MPQIVRPRRLRSECPTYLFTDERARPAQRDMRAIFVDDAQCDCP